MGSKYSKPIQETEDKMEIDGDTHSDSPHDDNQFKGYQSNFTIVYPDFEFPLGEDDFLDKYPDHAFVIHPILDYMKQTIDISIENDTDISEVIIGQVESTRQFEKNNPNAYALHMASKKVHDYFVTKTQAKQIVKHPQVKTLFTRELCSPQELGGDYDSFLEHEDVVKLMSDIKSTYVQRMREQKSETYATQLEVFGRVYREVQTKSRKQRNHKIVALSEAGISFETVIKGAALTQDELDLVTDTSKLLTLGSPYKKAKRKAGKISKRSF